MKNWVWPKPFRFVAAMLRAAWARLRGYEILANEDERDERSEQCDYCEEITRSGQCRICSCLTSAKVVLTTESCPKGKWKAIWRKRRLTKPDGSSTS